MASQAVVVFLLCVGVASALSTRGRISGGTTTTIEEYPMTAQVDSLEGVFWTQSCAATILTSRYVLSAAQCFNGPLFSILFRRIRVGSDLRNSGGEVFHLETVRNHPNFDPEDLSYDITLVRLDEPLSYLPTIQPGTIIAGGYPLPENIPVSLVGWGYVAEDEPAEELQRVTAVTMHLDKCRALYEEEAKGSISVNNLCVGPEEEQSDAGACAGDVGGPVIYHQEPYSLVVGVISWRHGCEHSTLPTVATAVTEFTNWIVENAV